MRLGGELPEKEWIESNENKGTASLNIPVLNVNSQGGVKADAGKPRWSLLPWLQVRHVVQVLTFGSLKYSDNNWQKVEPYRYKDAIGRHWQAYMAGEKTDEESGYPHLAHLVCCALFLLWFDDNV